VSEPEEEYWRRFGDHERTHEIFTGQYPQGIVFFLSARTKFISAGEFKTPFANYSNIPQISQDSGPHDQSSVK
jgi:hypothetical protein